MAMRPLDSSLTKLSGGLSELAQQGDELTNGSAALDAGVSELAGVERKPYAGS